MILMVKLLCWELKIIIVYQRLWWYSWWFSLCRKTLEIGIWGSVRAGQSMWPRLRQVSGLLQNQSVKNVAERPNVMFTIIVIIFDIIWQYFTWTQKNLRYSSFVIIVIFDCFRLLIINHFLWLRSAELMVRVGHQAALTNATMMEALDLCEHTSINSYLYLHTLKVVEYIYISLDLYLR